MFSKVLVAEDMSSINEGISAVLKKVGITTIHHSQYCDNALLKLKRALKDNAPYQLLISDMSFKKDHHDDKIANGEELIKLAKALDPNLKIVAYSIEDKVTKVKRLFDLYNIDGYVCKDRRGLIELVAAIKDSYTNKRFVSPNVASALQENSTSQDFSDYDVVLLKLLAGGHKQTELPNQLQKINISPNSVSAIEKRLGALKTIFGANNTVHLISLTKDLGLI